MDGLNLNCFDEDVIQEVDRLCFAQPEPLPAWQAMPARVAAPVAAPEPAGAVPLIPAESIEAFRRATLSLRAAQAELAVARDRMRAGLAELTAQVDESLDAVTRALARYEVARVLYETLEEAK
jgi:hypothetical protein